MDVGVEVELVLFDEEHEAGGGERFGNAADTELGWRGDGRVGLKIGEAEAFRPKIGSVMRDGDGDAGGLGEDIFPNGLAGGVDGVWERRGVRVETKEQEVDE